jgi:outer membrane murein-binding lipoprotein Lpp
MSDTDGSSDIEITTYLTLGERLLAGVQNLWSSVHQLTAKTDKHDKVIEYLLGKMEEMQCDIDNFRKEIRGLKIARGKARARADRLEQMARDAASQLERARHHLTSIH